MPNENKPQTGAQSVYRALEVLEAFTQTRVSLSAADLAELTGLTVPTAHRIANALSDKGFLVRDDLSRTYGIGPAVLRLAQVATSGESAFAFVNPLIDHLRDSWQETVGLHMRVGDSRVCVREVESPHRVRVVSGVGQTYALNTAAASKAIVAFMAEDELAKLAQSVPQLLEKPFQEVLEQIREYGYATSTGETIPGARAIAAPVLDANGHAIASVNVTGPSQRFTEERGAEVGDDLVIRLRHLHDARYSGLSKEVF